MLGLPGCSWLPLNALLGLADLAVKKEILLRVALLRLRPPQPALR